MTHAEVQKLAQTFAAYAAYYRTALADEVLKMYAKDLADLSFDRVMAAMNNYRRDPKNRFCPMPAQIREMLEDRKVDPLSAAREIAARIGSAIPKFGWCGGAAAREYIGEVGWEIVETQGGWTYLCEHHGLRIDPSTFQAQVRDLALSRLTNTAGAMAERIQLGPSQSPELSELRRVLASVPSIPQLPEGE